jgi:hypothetical protein
LKENTNSSEQPAKETSRRHFLRSMAAVPTLALVAGSSLLPRYCHRLSLDRRIDLEKRFRVSPASLSRSRSAPVRSSTRAWTRASILFSRPAASTSSWLPFLPTGQDSPDVRFRTSLSLTTASRSTTAFTAASRACIRSSMLTLRSKKSALPNSANSISLAM